ncbi:12592_t:CDS:1, partial [Gigaspora margarita]
WCSSRVWKHYNQADQNQITSTDLKTIVDAEVRENQISPYITKVKFLNLIKIESISYHKTKT